MRVGFLGTGHIACEHAKVVLALGHQIVAGSARAPGSPRWARFKALAPEARFVADGEALLRAEDVDVVIACLNWNVTQTWLERLLACTKPVLIEKPASLELHPLKVAVERFSENLQNKRVAYNRRFYEPVRALKERLTAGGLKSAEVTISEHIDHHVKRYGREIVPHILLFASSHILDLVLFLFQPVRVARVYGHEEDGESAPFVSFNIVLETETGIPIWLSLNANDPSPVGIRCRFDDGSTWHLAPLEVLRIYKGFEIIPATAKTNIRQHTPILVEEVVADSQFKPGFLSQMDAFLNGTFKEAATLEELVELLELVEEFYAKRRSAAAVRCA